MNIDSVGSVLRFLPSLTQIQMIETIQLVEFSDGEERSFDELLGGK